MSPQKGIIDYPELEKTHKDYQVQPLALQSQGTAVSSSSTKCSSTDSLPPSTCTAPSSDHPWFSNQLMEVGILWMTVSTVQCINAEISRPGSNRFLGPLEARA